MLCLSRFWSQQFEQILIILAQTLWLLQIRKHALVHLVIDERRLDIVNFFESVDVHFADMINLQILHVLKLIMLI